MVSEIASYDSFFQALVGHLPYPYQKWLAEQTPNLIEIPTGLGKTAGVVIPWIYHQSIQTPGTPRRLIFCLPMRVLVQQTYELAISWLQKASDGGFFSTSTLPSVHLLMGGAVDEEWQEAPTVPVMLVGTQDMLLSRALNRGFGMSRFRWPMHFGALHNDACWVFDEIQLMGVGVRTSAQLEGLRGCLGTFGPTRSVWMSATLDERLVETVDHPLPPDGWQKLTLGEEDKLHPQVQKRTQAHKALRKIEVPAPKRHKKNGFSAYAEALAAKIAKLHQVGTLTLVIINRVERAQALFQVLQREVGDDRPTYLLHSRFRLSDRHEVEVLLDSLEDAILISTQVVEAGVDLSARVLLTELAPWPSLIQRFGRCNRKGEFDEASVYWIDLECNDKEQVLPYTQVELACARGIMQQIESEGGTVGPASLASVRYEPDEPLYPVLRRRDLLELFDTTPDLSGADLDVSSYVRDSEDLDVQVFWRDWEERETPPPDDLARPQRNELCRVSLRAIREFAGCIKEHDSVWHWDGLDGRWCRRRAEDIVPGMVLLLHCEAGGYSQQIGWHGRRSAQENVLPLAADTPAQEATSDEPGTETGSWLNLTQHLQDVVDAMEGLLRHIELSEEWKHALIEAARWHDVGKAHQVFQMMLGVPAPSTNVDMDGSLWAKSGPAEKLSKEMGSNTRRRFFRHELASALIWLEQGELQSERDKDLVAYLIAAHHGKVRLSLRALPGEMIPEPREGAHPLFARGVWDGDKVPCQDGQQIELPGGRKLPPLTLDLSLMKMGTGSWLEKMLGLRDDPCLGPFRLAYLEMLLRVADWCGSRHTTSKR